MKIKKKIRVKSLQGTSYMISEDQKIGKGAYGQVYRAYNREIPNQQLVAKIIELHKVHNLHSIQAELQVIRELPKHQNLVNCVKAHIESTNNLYIIMQYCNQGSLQGYIQKMMLLPQDKIWDILTQICRGYQVLNDAHLLHRDIKPQNILIHNGTFKLADFGLAKRLQHPDITQNLSFKGTPLFIAPEIVENKEGSSKVDVFSLGCVIYQLAYDGLFPFFSQNKNYKSIDHYFEDMKKCELVLKQKNKKGQLRSLELRELISKMLQKDQQKRISWQQIFSHKRININRLFKQSSHRSSNSNEKELQFLRNSLIQVNRSSAKFQQFPEIQNIREQSENMTVELIQFQQYLGHQQLRQLQHLMFRFKITLLAILHTNSKMMQISKQNAKSKELHKHVLQQFQQTTLQGLQFLLKIIKLLLEKISGYQISVVGKLKQILQSDQHRIQEQYRKYKKNTNNSQISELQQQISHYDLRKYQNVLYNFITEYCDYHQSLKLKVKPVISLLIDIYDSSLKLIELTTLQNPSSAKTPQPSQIQTVMDSICWNKMEPQQFHQYLMKKQHVSQQQISQGLKSVGLLFL